MAARTKYRQRLPAGYLIIISANRYPERTHWLKLATVDEKGAVRAQAKPTTNMLKVVAQTRSIDLGCAPAATKSNCLERLSSRYVRIRIAALLLTCVTALNPLLQKPSHRVRTFRKFYAETHWVTQRAALSCGLRYLAPSGNFMSDGVVVALWL
jgi:hypothetical protein